MNKPEFKQLITDIYNFYDRTKIPSNAQLAIWYDEVDKIPSIAVKQIYKNIISTHEAFPSNKVMAIKDSYRAFKSSHPENFLIDKKECKICNKTGYIIAQKKMESTGKPYDFIFRCGHCENWKILFGENACPISTTYNLEQNGYLPLKSSS